MFNPHRIPAVPNRKRVRHQGQQAHRDVELFQILLSLLYSNGCYLGMNKLLSTTFPKELTALIRGY